MHLPVLCVKLKLILCHFFFNCSIKVEGRWSQCHCCLNNILNILEVVASIRKKMLKDK